MLKTCLWLPALCLAAFLPSASAQPAYTYVAEYSVPRAQWAEFSENFQKNLAPVLERLVADGTILEFAATANTVHLENGNTHTFWWAAPTFAGTQRVLAELAKLGPGPSLSGIKHRDRLLRSVVYRSKTARATSGFAWVSTTYAQPGKNQQWRELFDKYTKPTYEKLFADGTILGYGADAEFVHTETPGARYTWYLAPSAEAVDKVNAELAAAAQSSTPEERRAVAAAFAEVGVAGSHRDGLDRILVYVHK